MAKAKLKIDQLAKLRQFTQGMDVEKFLSSEFRQVVKALEQSYVETDDPAAPQTFNEFLVNDSRYSQSGGSGLFTTTSATLVDITNLSITYTGNGGLIVIGLKPFDSTSDSTISCGNASSNLAAADYYLLKDGAAIGSYGLSVSSGGATSVNTAVPSSSILFQDTSFTTGSRTYKMQVRANVGTARCTLARMYLYEI